MPGPPRVIAALLRPGGHKLRSSLWRGIVKGGYLRLMEDATPEPAPSRVPVRTVITSIVGMWSCYFVLTTIRAEIFDLGFTEELLLRRAAVTLTGIGVTFAMWLVLRLFDFKPLWMKICAALIVAAPVSIILAQANTMAFADVETMIMARMVEKQGLRVRRDDSGNILFDLPLSRPPGYTAAPQSLPEGSRRDETSTLDELPDSIIVASQTAKQSAVLQLTEIALGRYFLMLAWCALYLALLAGEQARSAERREGAFRRAAKAAELRSLRYQVNPHFLFNTLNSLSALVLTGRPRQAEAMIQTISTFYRRSLAGDPTADVPLGEEFALQQLYLDIEAVRFPDRLVAVYDLPAALAEARVPGMILQPLVENSVKHAVALSSRKVTIILSAREEDGGLIITVSDDGDVAGKTGKARAGHGIGLANVHERIHARFGDGASVVSGQADGGYVTRIRIPLVVHG